MVSVLTICPTSSCFCLACPNLDFYLMFSIGVFNLFVFTEFCEALRNKDFQSAIKMIVIIISDH